MNKRILKRLAIISCIPGILSCCSFIDAMKNQKNSSSKKSIAAKQKKAIRKQTTYEVLEGFLSERKNKEGTLAYSMQKYSNNEKPKKNTGEKNTKDNKKSVNEMAKYTKADEAMDILFDKSLSYSSSDRLHMAFDMFRDMSSDEKKSFIAEVIKHARPGSEVDTPLFTDDIDWKNTQFKRYDDFEFDLEEKYDDFAGQYAGIRCEERFVGGLRIGDYTCIASVLELYNYEPNSSKFKSTDAIEVHADIGANCGRIMIGSKEDIEFVEKIGFLPEAKRNAWTIKIIKYD